MGSRYVAPTSEQMGRLRFDISAGTAVWVSPNKYHSEKAGMVAGCIRSKPKPYWHIKIDGIAYKRSHLIFYASTGVWPSLLDHINGNSLYDSIENLRLATNQQNCWNVRRKEKISLLPTGVRKLQRGGYQARITYNGKLITIGTFPSPDIASNVYQNARKEYFGEFA